MGVRVGKPASQLEEALCEDSKKGVMQNHMEKGSKAVCRPRQEVPRTRESQAAHSGCGLGWNARRTSRSLYTWQIAKVAAAVFPGPSEAPKKKLVDTMWGRRFWGKNTSSRTQKWQLIGGQPPRAHAKT